MTKQKTHCGWCGGVIPEPGGAGRPRRYCRRSHRQRAFEARRLGAARGLGADEAVVNAGELANLIDNLYLLESTLDDDTDDLRGNPDAAEVLEAHLALRNAAAEVVRAKVEPKALGTDSFE